MGSNPKDITDSLVAAKGGLRKRQQAVLDVIRKGELLKARESRKQAMDWFVVFAYSILILFGLTQAFLIGWMDWF